MDNIQKTVNKRKNNADLRISVDPGIATWLGNLFGCSKEDAVAILVNINEKRRGADDTSEI